MAELIQYANGVPGIRWPVDKPILHIGRAEESNDIWLDDAFVSKKHAQIIVKHNPDAPGGVDFYVLDLQSTNHTYVNQESIAEYRLQHNDVLMIGKNKLVFVCEGVKSYLSSADFSDNQTETLPAAAIPEAREVVEEESSDDLTLITATSLPDKNRFSRRLNIQY
ncbi:MAG: FHA domain-containing protein [Gammaproteobacteria bacterium]|nr:FHA domain-containing protein [Gammaproteobacteria bacterium]